MREGPPSPAPEAKRDRVASETRQLQAITEAMTVFLERGDVGAASQPLLAGAFDLTESEYGFVGVVTEGPRLRVLAHRGLVWHETENREFYEQALRGYRNVGYLEFDNFDTLFGHVIRSGRALIANHASRHPAAGGLPPGHPPLDHFLGVPFLLGDEVIGMIAVANRPGGYREIEQRRLEAIAGAAGVLYDSYRRQLRQAAFETERKHADDALRESNQRLQRALRELEAAQDRIVREERLRALGLMASGIAHDFNNSLQGILGFADYLLSDPSLLDDRAETVEALEMIRTSASDASRIVEQLGAFHRPAEARSGLAPIELDALFEQVVGLTRPRWRDEALAAGTEIRVELELGEAPVVLGDAQALREALTNLIFNAVDAMPGGGTLRCRTFLAGGDVILEVADTGVGMENEVRERCLEPFYSTKEAPRSGMGLSMVWGVVQRHGGDIEIESEPGLGTRVRVKLPLVPVLEESEVEAASLAPADGKEPRLRILLVDDEASVREALTRILRRRGHSVDAQPNAHRALRRLEEPATFDLVITD